MQLGSPLEALSAALYHAAHLALPDTTYETRDFEALYRLPTVERETAMLNGTYPRKTVIRRPEPSECSVPLMFTEVWSSTALGFGGLGGAAMTPAYTVIVQGPRRDLAVYWGGRFAYLIPSSISGEQLKNWVADIEHRKTVPKSEAEARYGAILGQTQSGY
jgi:hypothetical protein